MTVVDHPGFALFLLGGFCLVTGTSVVNVPRSSQRLLVYLRDGGVVNRATVAGRLGPDVAEHHAYTNLRRPSRG